MLWFLWAVCVCSMHVCLSAILCMCFRVEFESGQHLRMHECLNICVFISFCQYVHVSMDCSSEEYNMFHLIICNLISEFHLFFCKLMSRLCECVFVRGRCECVKLWVSVCECMCVCVCVSVCVIVNECVWVYVNLFECVYEYLSVSTCVWVHANVSEHVWVCGSVCDSANVWSCMSVYVSVWVCDCVSECLLVSVNV